MKIINSIKTTERYLKQRPNKLKANSRTVAKSNKSSVLLRGVSEVAGIVLLGGILLGHFAKKDIDKNGIPDIVETITERFSKYSYKEMSNLNPTKSLIIWACTNKELMKFYRQEHIYDQEIKNSMRHIVALAHLTKEYKSPIIARSIGCCKEIFDAFKFDFDKADWENNEVGINYVINNPNCSRDDILQYAYEYAKDKKTQSDIK